MVGAARFEHKFDPGLANVQVDPVAQMADVDDVGGGPANGKQKLAEGARAVSDASVEP